ncbi:hypothetical protein PAMC26577_21980 [Caballeronia sordidicola]|uniref:Uncharacterized protein n=1 Tax=Caballeronia sordidicola TaxID=196367 RepID=A0A242MLR0_CABSO|nr:hypothetical protein PAMC26577_21980 [Caballeronia sordidicola]
MDVSHRSDSLLSLFNHARPLQSEKIKALWRRIYWRAASGLIGVAK